jgi:acyl-coenzyme A thioesterase PaaI-like protein
LEPTVETIQSFLWEFFPIYKHIGLTVESAAGGLYSCRIPMIESNQNHIGTVHACIQWAAAEVLGGLVILANFDHSRLFFVVRTVTIQFLKPARTDLIAEASLPDERVRELQAHLLRHGEVGFALDATVRDNQGVTVAETVADYLIRNKRE